MKEEITALCTLVRNLERKIDSFQSKPTLVYSNAEVAKMFGVCTHMLTKWRNEGMLGYSRKGGVIFYSPEDIKEFIQNTHHEAVNASIAGGWM